MKHILLVDDSVANLNIANAALEPYYKVTMLTSGAQLLKYLSKNIPDLILLDIEMPQLDGFGVLEKLEENGLKNSAPIIFLTSVINSDLEAKAFSAGVVDFINKPFATMPLLSRVKMHLEISEYRKSLEGLVAQKTRTIEELQDVLSISIAKLVGCRDGYTGEHVMRTHTYLNILLEQMLSDGTYEKELTPQLCKDMLRAAALHDIGKVGIQDEILCKKGQFSENEFELMKMHTTLGGQTLQNAIEACTVESFLYVARDMAQYHHEKWDGSGYVFRLSGENIPLCARIMTVVDVYDALTSKRPYKEPFSHEKSLGIIKEGSGKAFDPRIIESFIRCAAVFEEYLKNRPEEGPGTP